jgi:hypothetical protein
MAAIYSFHTGKTVVQIAVIEIAIDHLLDIGPIETVLPGKMLVIDPDKGFKIVLYTAVVIRRRRISGPYSRSCGGLGRNGANMATSTGAERLCPAAWCII